MNLSSLRVGELEDFIYLERYVNEGSPSGFGLESGLEKAYLPGSDQRGIEIPVFWLHFEELTTVGYFDSLFSPLPEGAGPTDVPFPIHPAVLGSFGQHRRIREASTRSTILAQPLASGRTVAFQNNLGQSTFIKLHFPQVLGRFNRALPMYKWLASLENSKEICRLIPTQDTSVALFPYIGGAFLETDGFVGGGGFLLRSIEPFPRLFEDSIFLPAFALWSSDTKAPYDEPLLIQYVRLLNLKPIDAVSAFISPLLKSYGFLALQCGFLCEDNAQNVVFEISKDLSTFRIVRRDMADVFKDEALRKDRGLYPLCTYHSLEGSVSVDVHKRRSFAYDFKLSRYIIDPILECLSRFLGASKLEMQEHVRSLSKALLRWPDGYFPENYLAYGYPKRGSVDRSSYVELHDEFLYR